MEPVSVAAPPSPAPEQGKLFVGGISSDTTEEDLNNHFGKFGQITEADVMRDHTTGNSRGFAFVQFFDPDAAKKALDDNEKDKHVIRGRTVDVKRAIPRSRQNQIQRFSQHENSHDDQGPSGSTSNSNSMNGNRFTAKKIFVGGLRDDITQPEFRGYFEKFGEITDAVIMHDKLTKRSRGFGFITFDSDEAVDKAMERSLHELKGRMVEVKRAVPKDGNARSNHRDDGSQSSGISGGQGMAYDYYHGPAHVPHSPQYDYFMPPAMSPYYFDGGSYGAGYQFGTYYPFNYGNIFPTLTSPWRGQSVVGPWSPMPYGSTGMYPGYLNGGGFDSYTGDAGSDYREADGLSNGNGNEIGSDIQSVGEGDRTNSGVEAAAVNGLLASQLEEVKLDA